jgi:hypothetical protein
MAHNPPIPARLDYADRLGMLILDENRDFGTVGIDDGELLPQMLTDMRDLIKVPGIPLPPTLKLAAQDLDWSKRLPAEGSIACECHGLEFLQ